MKPSPGRSEGDANKQANSRSVDGCWDGVTLKLGAERRCGDSNVTKPSQRLRLRRKSKISFAHSKANKVKKISVFHLFSLPAFNPFCDSLMEQQSVIRRRHLPIMEIRWRCSRKLQCQTFCTSSGKCLLHERKRHNMNYKFNACFMLSFRRCSAFFTSVAHHPHFCFLTWLLVTAPTTRNGKCWKFIKKNANVCQELTMLLAFVNDQILNRCFINYIANTTNLHIFSLFRLHFPFAIQICFAIRPTADISRQKERRGA